MWRATIAATGIPFGTGRLPPCTKSAWRSIASKAFLIGPLPSLDWPSGIGDSSGRAHTFRQVRGRVQRCRGEEPGRSRPPRGARTCGRQGRCAVRPAAARVSARKIAPYGSWASDVTVDLLLKRTVHMRNQMVRWDGGDLYWSELRPDEAGRIVVCRRDSRDGAISDVTPSGFNARTRVHEYGGGHFAVSGGTVWFTNFQDQRLYRQEIKQGVGGSPRPITSAVDVRHADMVVDDRRGRVYAVREDHTNSK